MTRRILLQAGAAACAALALAPRAARAAIKADETVVFFPSAGYRVAPGGDWRIDVRARVYERESRPLAVPALEALRAAFGLDGLTDAEEALFRERMRLFLDDSESGKRLTAQVGARLLPMGRSASGGFVAASITLAERDIPRFVGGSAQRWVPIRAVLDTRDKRSFNGMAQLVEPAGTSVVSDIDDTIKQTGVRDARELARNTFARPFRAVAGMAALYAGWARATPDIAFHYVSASPWQLYEPLDRFRTENDFPLGSWHLREFSLKRPQAFASPENSRAHKSAEIERLLRNFPQRAFVLVGDSGERDPEIYADLAARHPQQVRRVMIRDTTGEPQTSARYASLFGALPRGLLRVFREPAAAGDLG